MRSSVSPAEAISRVLCVTRRWRWASAAEAGACWRSPPPCCSGGTPSASRCPSRMSRSCCGASSLSPPARYATLPRWCGSRHHVLHLDLKKIKIFSSSLLKSSFPSHRLSPLLVPSLVLSKQKDKQQGRSGRSLRLRSHPHLHTCDINYVCRPGTLIT